MILKKKKKWSINIVKSHFPLYEWLVPSCCMKGNVLTDRAIWYSLLSSLCCLITAAEHATGWSCTITSTRSWKYLCSFYSSQPWMNEWMYSVEGFARSFRRACFFNILLNHCWNSVLPMRTILSNPCQVGAAPILTADIGKLFRTQLVPKEKYKEARLVLPRCVQGNIACQRPVTWYIRASAYYMASDQSIKTRNQRSISHLGEQYCWNCL